MLQHVSRTKHLILQTVNEGTAGPRGDEIHSVGVQFLLRGIVSPLPARGELSRSKELLGPFMGRTLPLHTETGKRKRIRIPYFVQPFLGKMLILCEQT